MRVTLADGEKTEFYSVRWQHNRRKPDWPRRQRESTTCRISETDERGTEIKPGVTVMVAVECSLKDQYCREKGRMLSLGLAMEDFDRAARKQFWEAYKRQIGVRAIQEAEKKARLAKLAKEERGAA